MTPKKPESLYHSRLGEHLTDVIRNGIMQVAPSEQDLSVWRNRSGHFGLSPFGLSPFDLSRFGLADSVRPFRSEPFRPEPFRFQPFRSGLFGPAVSIYLRSFRSRHLCTQTMITSYDFPGHQANSQYV